MAVGGEVIQLRAAVVPAVAYREREVVKHRDIYTGEEEARGSLQRVRQVDTARGLAEVIELVERLTELLRESKAQEVGMRVSLEKEGEACGTKAK